MTIAVWPVTAMAEVTIQNNWHENGTTYAVVEYRNTSNKTYSNAVTIRCNTISADGKTINTNTRSFFKHEYGPIAPGFSGTVKVPISDAGNKKAVNITCTKNAW